MHFCRCKQSVCSCKSKISVKIVKKMPGKSGKILNFQQNENLNWQKVKIKGPVISNDASGLEGLIGLEVLEDYNLQSVLKGGEVSVLWT